MDWLLPTVVVLGLVTVSTASGLIWRARQGAHRAVAGEAPLRPSLLGDHPFGERATLVQFSTEFCSRCPATRRVLADISGHSAGVAYVDVDVTHRADLVRRFGILQTPTTLILDRRGVVRTRIGGAVRRAAVEQTLEELR